MDTNAIIFLSALAVFSVGLLGFVIYYYQRRHQIGTDTQRSITDRDLLQRIADEPDGLLSPHHLAATTELSLAQARSRLQSLQAAGILNTAYNSSLKAYYSLKEPIPGRPSINLSPDPFLTVEDILTIFQLFDFRISDQDLIVATGLSLAMIKREMKYFMKQNVVEQVTTTAPQAGMSVKSYILKEPYRSHPERFRDQAEKLDLEMREILRSDNLIV